ncbi:hypothetical protein HYFRA_00004277 [Hymenoscyphus fraxineus]|uniref:Integral membrane bound transporter domain-containing protein n=1 Tax=Hymenoscyphus fraxineus TaxID=746836 RepID=A0A9N9KMT3_9HELO|nr:hypothetical protein HYFRA_00004277 [Hymenoscyphus fraxineus]
MWQRVKERAKDENLGKRKVEEPSLKLCCHEIITRTPAHDLCEPPTPIVNLPNHERNKMSSPSAPDGSAPPQSSTRRSSRWSRRNKLRNGTFILPSTGERVRRQITLRNPAGFEAPSSAPSARSDGLPPLRRTYSRAGTFRSAVDNTKESIRELWQWFQTPMGKGVLKCSIAYLIGSMATFLPPIANFLGKQDGKHIVATITVYFHPARSIGSMEEGALLGLAAFLYATFISILSMAVAVYFESQLDLISVAYVLIVVVFCGGGLGLVGWTKQKFNTPLVSVAASTTSIAIITVLTKENAVQIGVFEDQKIIQVMKMVIMGLSTSFAVCMLIWPVSARKELKETMIRTTDSLSSMLSIITRGFLSGSETDMRSSSFNKAHSKYKQVYTQMTKNLREARFEHYFLGREEQYKKQAKLVKCMQRLATSIGGLRSAAATQFALLRELPYANGSSLPDLNLISDPFLDGGPITPSNSRFAVLTAIEEASEEGSGAEDQHARRKTPPNLDSIETPPISAVRTPPEIFSRFITHLGPSMKSLAYTLTKILDELPFGPGPTYCIAINENFQTSLTDALKMYSGARDDALKELYESKDISRERPASVEADFEEVAASCGHFSFSLIDFAEDMQRFLSILEDLKESTENPKRSWNWLKFWQKPKPGQDQETNTDPEQEHLIDQNGESDGPKDNPDLVLKRRQHGSWKVDHEGEESVKSGLYRVILKVVRFLERDDIRFAIKVGLGAALWSVFAFIPETRPIYRHWRGEWGLVSFMLVCSMTIGASNTTGYARFVGTFVGAISATLVWSSCRGNAYALAFCGWLFSIPCFYLIVARGKGPLGRFTILTYNLSCLYAYSLSVREGDYDEDEGGETPAIIEIASHRVVSVLTGVLWGLIVARVIWPISARQKFKDGLSLLWLRMGLIWKRDPLSALLEGDSAESYLNLREEISLQQYVLRLDALRRAAASEFELRGPFPGKAYGRIMESTSKMLDAFHAMNVLIQKDVNPSEGEVSLLKYTKAERRQLCARISHLFQVLASSLKLEYPMSDGLPDAVNPRDRLLTKIFQYRKMAANSEDPSIVIATDGDYELLYAYALVTGQLADEIGKVEKEVKGLFAAIDAESLKLQ